MVHEDFIGHHLSQELNRNARLLSIEAPALTWFVLTLWNTCTTSQSAAKGLRLKDKTHREELPRGIVVVEANVCPFVNLVEQGV